jgi:hypothetical protein
MQIDVIAVRVRITPAETTAASNTTRPLGDRVSDAAWRAAIFGVRCVIGAVCGVMLAGIIELALVIYNN